MPEDETEAIVESLEVCAARVGDIVPPVFERFFERDDSARELMEHSDQHMQGRMFESVLELFMSDEHFGRGKYLDWELRNHLEAYAATPAMYRAFFDAVLDVVRDALGSDWSARYDHAWQRRIERIMDQVNVHESTSRSA